MTIIQERRDEWRIVPTYVFRPPRPPIRSVGTYFRAVKYWKAAAYSPHKEGAKEYTKWTCKCLSVVTSLFNWKGNNKTVRGGREDMETCFSFLRPFINLKETENKKMTTEILSISKLNILWVDCWG
jgi:hypothetical protein